MLRRFIVDSQTDWAAGIGDKIDLTTAPGSLRLAKFADAVFSRASSAYLDGVEYGVDAPRYLPGGGVMVEEGTENLLPAERATSFDAPWYASLDGVYTLSVQAGSGELHLSGAALGIVRPGESLTFSADGVVLVTPSGGIPELVQLEEKSYATSWHGGQ